MEEFASPLAHEDYVRALSAASEKLVGDFASARCRGVGERRGKPGVDDWADHASPENDLHAADRPPTHPDEILLEGFLEAALRAVRQAG